MEVFNKCFSAGQVHCPFMGFNDACNVEGVGSDAFGNILSSVDTQNCQNFQTHCPKPSELLYNSISSPTDVSKNKVSTALARAISRLM